MTDTEREIQRRAAYLQTPEGGGLSPAASINQAYNERAGAGAYARVAAEAASPQSQWMQRMLNPEDVLAGNSSQNSRPRVGQVAAGSDVVNLGMFR